MTKKSASNFLARVKGDPALKKASSSKVGDENTLKLPATSGNLSAAALSVYSQSAVSLVPSKGAQGTKPSVVSTTRDLMNASRCSDPSQLSQASASEDVASKAPTADKHEIDGGLTAYLAVLSSFLIHFVVLGIFYNFGVFQQHYRSLFPANQDWELTFVGSVGPSMVFLAGIVTGRIAERRGFRITMLGGSIIMSLGVFLTGFATEVWHLAVTQGLLYGVGGSLAYIPALAVPSQWWKVRRSFATGIAVSGSGVGGLTIANLTDAYAPRLGIMVFLRVLGGASLIILLAATALAKTRLPPRGDDGTPLLDWSWLRDPKFVPLALCSVITPFGYMVPFYFIPSYAADVSNDPMLSSQLLTAINVMSICGRIGTGYLADTLGNVNCFILSIFMAGLASLAFWLPAALLVPSGYSFGLLLTFAGLFGFFAGGFISLTSSVAAQLYGVERLPTMVGIMYAFEAPGDLAGAPIAGLLIGQASSNVKFGGVPTSAYGPAILWASLTMIAGALSVVYLRVKFLDTRLFVRV